MSPVSTLHRPFEFVVQVSVEVETTWPLLSSTSIVTVMVAPTTFVDPLRARTRAEASQEVQGRPGRGQLDGLRSVEMLSQFRVAFGGTVVEVVLEVEEVDEVEVELVDVELDVDVDELVLLLVEELVLLLVDELDDGPPPPPDVDVVTWESWQFVGGGRSETQFAWLASSSSARVSSTRRTTISARAIPVRASAYSGIAAPRRRRALAGC
jgi:hypothetical protein